MVEESDRTVGYLRQELLKWSQGTCVPQLHSSYEIVSEIAQFHGHNFDDAHEYIFVGVTNVCPPDTYQHVTLKSLHHKDTENHGEFFVFDTLTFWPVHDPFQRRGPIRLYLQRNELFFVCPR